jgi:TRAP-type C4-dicarboxylate transport system permease small subunit
MKLLTARFLAGLGWVEAAVAVSAYMLVAGLLLADVLGREFFGTSIYGAQKVAVIATIAAAFMGLSMATGRGSHLRAEAMDRLVPRQFSALADRLGQLVSFALFAALTWYSLQFALGTRSLGLRLPVLGWQMWPMQMVLPVAFGLSAIKVLLFFLHPALSPRRAVNEEIS